MGIIDEVRDYQLLVKSVSTAQIYKGTTLDCTESLSEILHVFSVEGFETSLFDCCSDGEQTVGDALLVSPDWEKRGVLQPSMRNYKNIGPRYIRFGCCYFSSRLLFTERRASV
jgi:hypothetical protein